MHGLNAREKLLTDLDRFDPDFYAVRTCDALAHPPINRGVRWTGGRVLRDFPNCDHVLGEKVRILKISHKEALQIAVWMRIGSMKKAELRNLNQ
jgi:hypothetical protein